MTSVKKEDGRIFNYLTDYLSLFTRGEVRATNPSLSLNLYIVPAQADQFALNKNWGFQRLYLLL